MKLFSQGSIGAAVRYEQDPTSPAEVVNGPLP